MTSPATPLDEALVAALVDAGQSHLVDHANTLQASDPEAADGFAAQLAEHDWPRVARRIDRLVVRGEDEAPYELDALEPPEILPWQATSALDDRYAAARSRGHELLRAGEVALLLVAGGQGSRLGWDGPKGTFPASPVRKATLFRLLAEQVTAARDRYGVAPAWVIMTGPTNHEDTIAFFEEQEFFGLDRDRIRFFQQGTSPAVDPQGRALLADSGELFVNPDGTGGLFDAIASSGTLDALEAWGVTQLSYVQVDNPSTHAFDPLFLGLHADADAEYSLKVLPKVDPAEKVGLIVRDGDKLRIVEYSDAPPVLTEAREPDGTLRFRAGSIAIHILSRAFVARVADLGDEAVAWHRADKKIDYWDPETGEHVDPDEPNAVKFERFVFDALPEARRSIVYETDRVEEFAPVKNAEGTDSPATSKALQIERAARWLERHGVDVPRTGDGEVDAVLEIRATTALEADDLADADLPEHIEAGAELLL